MPTLLRWQGWRFHFYSYDRVEPAHVHISKGRQELKVWLANLRVASNKRCSDREISVILRIVSENRDAFLEAWDEHCRD